MDFAIRHKGGYYSCPKREGAGGGGFGVVGDRDRESTLSIRSGRLNAFPPDSAKLINFPKLQTG